MFRKNKRPYITFLKRISCISVQLNILSKIDKGSFSIINIFYIDPVNVFLVNIYFRNGIKTDVEMFYNIHIKRTLHSGCINQLIQ